MTINWWKNQTWGYINCKYINFWIEILSSQTLRALLGKRECCYTLHRKMMVYCNSRQHLTKYKLTSTCVLNLIRHLFCPYFVIIRANQQSKNTVFNFNEWKRQLPDKVMVMHRHKTIGKKTTRQCGTAYIEKRDIETWSPTTILSELQAVVF